MGPSRLTLFLSILIITATWSCASVVSPSGGPRDTRPPQIDSAASTNNYQVLFEKQRIELTFDEWVVLERPNQQVLVSPPLDYPPEITLRKKTVRFDFDDREILRPNTTYTINFGTAVVDLTEKNPANDLRFVFSTGPVIDSLTLSGQVVNAQTQEPAEKILVMLYDDRRDSVVYTDRPLYFGKTNTNGTFQIRNIRADSFKVFALEDLNSNYLFDQVEERIAFSDSLIQIEGLDTPPLRLRLFQEELPLQRQQLRTRTFGKVAIQFNRAPRNLTYDYEDVGQSLTAIQEGDSLVFWYDLRDSIDWQLFLQEDSTYFDTIPVAARERAKGIKNYTFSLEAPRIEGYKHQPAEPLNLYFRLPVGSIDTNRLQLLADTLRTPVQPSWRIDPTNPKRLTVQHRWRGGRPYELLILPAGITDFFERPISDTLLMTFSTYQPDELGNIDLQVGPLDSMQQYIIQILPKDGKADQAVESFITRQTTQTTQRLEGLLPGPYDIVVITDQNRNGRWDSGDYLLKQQPEPYFRIGLEAVRANWDVQADVVLGRQ